MMSLGVSCPLENFPFPYVFSHNLFKQQGFPFSSGFRQSHKIVEGWNKLYQNLFIQLGGKTYGYIYRYEYY